MNEVDELFTAMLAIVFTVMLVGGGLYIENRPMQASAVPAQRANYPQRLRAINPVIDSAMKQFSVRPVV
jgi:hypothetical protein